MKLIVGLGNPGTKFLNTRHNVGFKVINALILNFGISLNKKKFNGKFYKNGNVIIAKPLTFMNNSGDFVQAISNFFKIIPSNILVVYDDMDHNIGNMSIKPKGSDGGHNGIKDIIQKIGTKDIARIKIGIGRKKESIEHVLGFFSKKEIKIVEKQIIPKVIKAIIFFLNNNLNKAMSEINNKNINVNNKKN